MKATWNGTLLAESDDTLVVEGTHYFPREALNGDLIRKSDHQTVCPWKGTASYYDVTVGDAVNAGAAWYYPEPKEAAQQIKGRVAFWRGVIVSE